MALYSVWDWRRNAWRVYETQTPASVGDDPLAPRPSGLSSLGADPDTHVKPLPSGARFVGYDLQARGEIRRMPGGLTDLGDDAGEASSPSRWWMFGAGVAAASAVWWWFGRNKA